MDRPPPEGFRPPSEGTLKRYGLTAADWLEMGRRQNWTCPVCRKPFADRRLVVDHAHVAGFKATRRRKSRDRKGRAKADTVRVRAMAPAERRAHVRGILHAWCNGYVRAWLTLDRAESIVEYLRAHAARSAAPRRGVTPVRRGPR